MHPHRSSAPGHKPPPLQRRTAGCTCGCACAACAAEAAASEALRLRVGGCIRETLGRATYAYREWHLFGSTLLKTQPV